MTIKPDKRNVVLSDRKENMRNTPSNSDDVIDSRDIIARIEELEDEREGLVIDRDEALEIFSDANLNKDDHTETELEKFHDDAESTEQALKEWDESDEGQELKALKALAEQCEGYGDWSHGETLIRDSYFTEYAQQLAEEIGAVGENSGWIVIDWEATAENLKADYMTVDFDGVEYLMRA